MGSLIQGRRTIAVVISVMAALSLTGALLYFHAQEPRPPKAAIIDQLSSSKLTDSSRYVNQTFIAAAKALLHTRFTEVDYYSDNATVDSYKSLPSMGYKLIVWRAHSAIDESGYIAISTSENNGSKDYNQYSNGELTLCRILGDPKMYFAITPKFITEVMSGRFEDTVIILMSCNGLESYHTKTAEALVEKGARALISWDGWIETYNNDGATALLLEYLISENDTIEQAVRKIPMQPSALGPSQMDFFPTGSGASDYHIPNYIKKTVVNPTGVDVARRLRKASIERHDGTDYGFEVNVAKSLNASSASKRSKTTGYEETPP